MKISQKEFTITVLRSLVGLIFVYAGMMKLGSPQAFSDNIASFSILPDSATNLLALTLPSFEILIGIVTVTGIHSRAGMLGIIGLTCIFLIAFSSAIIRKIPVDCGCFGPETVYLPPWLAEVRNILILAIAIFVYFSEAKIEIKQSKSINAMKKIIYITLVIGAILAATMLQTYADDSCGTGPADDPQCE